MTQDCFRPKYTAGHWLHLFREPFVYLAYVAMAVSRVESLKDLVSVYNSKGVGDGLPLPVYEPTLVVAAGLFGLLVLLGMISFLADDHIRKIKVSSEGIVFHRGLGRKIIVEYQTVKWDDALLALNKRHCFSMNKIVNREAMKEYLSEVLLKTPEEPEKEQKVKVAQTNWYDVKVLIVILAFIGLAVLLFYPWHIPFTEPLGFCIDGVLGLVTILYGISLARDLLS